MSSNQPGAQIPPDMKAFNEKLIAEFRANEGKLSGRLAQSQLMLLTTTGKKSGKARTVVIGYRRDGDRYLAIASNNGADAAPMWYANLLTNPSATVEIGSERFDVRARTAPPNERERLGALIEYFAGQQAKAKREIPIVVFERV